MNASSAVLLALAGLVAVGDWYAVAVGRERLERVAKPLTLLLLIATAVALDPTDAGVRGWFVAALVFSLLGDVFLLNADRFFVFGLAAFLVGHIAYIVGFWVGPTEAGFAVLGVVLAAVALATLGRRIGIAVARSEEPSLLGPVVAYMAVISAMVVSAFAATNPWAIAGAVLFYASDTLIAWNRFVSPRRWIPVGIMVTYHLGQAGLVVSLAS